ncbi:NADPH-dependent pterin aldehyde reductase-like [Benincasa hispida]|uniref:NADPH-dependent pterin aldehyde reductase-like n=1 Tax=Benincasa hispida TaxID=102211 RepID=UPI0018FFC723|nr:NADPH-dependent pterin aldehyde reductase-like [Benincasa hispida]
MEVSKKVLVTGVSKGLGRALALELATHNHTIIGCSRSQLKLDSLQAELSKLSPNNHHLLINVDVTSNSSVKKFAQLVAENNLVPDIIVNNAALASRKSKIWEIEDEEVDNVIDTNVKGIINVMRHFIPLLIHNKQGVIINMSSNAGREAFGEYALYCASKWAVEGLSKCVAKELVEELAMVSLDPGVIYTDMLALCMGDDMASQFQSPEEWALKAATIILGITTSDNGASLTIN